MYVWIFVVVLLWSCGVVDSCNCIFAYLWSCCGVHFWIYGMMELLIG